MDLFEAIETRSSAGRLVAPGPDPAQLERILAAAVHAPDHGRLKPWRLSVLDDAGRRRYADAVMSARARRPPEPTAEQLRIEGEKIWRSPTVVVVGCVVHKDHAKVPEIEQVLSVGAVAQNLFLAAHALGFGVMWKTGWAAYDDEVKASVGLQPHDHLVGIMHLGTRVQ
jgi:nitroreductase